MIYPTEVTLPFADGEYRFFLDLPQANELEGAGMSMCQLEWHLREGVGVDDRGQATFAGGGTATAKAIRNTIRLALIGGNCGKVDGEEIEVGPGAAKDLIEAYAFPARPLGESAALAWRILAAAIYGNEPAKSMTAAEPVTAPQEPEPTDE